MQRSLALSHLRADLNTAQQMLKGSIESDDYMGKIQFESRVKELQSEIQKLASSPDGKASITLFFDGAPVIGSRAISASFAGKMLKYFQELISKDSAIANLGNIGERGSVPDLKLNQLMITGLAHGSFGFTLEEVSDFGEILETNLSTSIKSVENKICILAAEQEKEFLEIVESIEARELLTLRNFFGTLAGEHATMRIVDSQKEFNLDEAGIHRARERIDKTTIEENDTLLACEILGILPEHKKFEARLESGEIIIGSISESAVKQYAALLVEDKIKIPGSWIISFHIKKVAPLNRTEKTTYKIMSFTTPIIKKGLS